MAVRFHFHNVRRIKGLNKLKSFIPVLFLKERKLPGELNVVVCDDEYLLDINKRFLNHNYYTDIITFDMGDPESNVVSGEIYISIDRVNENALLHSVEASLEFERVLFHGALHLCGYKDKSKNDSALMRKKENYYLRLFHVEQ
ncbi:MAG: rRNA maturation RNase YbeY [Bacteroidetes bacterium]|nr:rRNA maturation RNase YbeY [Bacteroidota bacterium]